MTASDVQSVQQAAYIQSPELPSNVFLINPAHEGLVANHHYHGRLLVRDLLDWLMLPIMLLLPVILLFNGLNGIVHDMTLRSISDLTHGEVINHRMVTTNSRSTLYYLTYRFDSGERIFQHEQLVSYKTYTDLPDGSSVSIKFVPDDPQISRLAGSNADAVTYENSAMLGLIGLLGTGLTLFAIVARVVMLWRDYYLRRFGKVIIGHVNSCRGSVRVTGVSYSPDNYGNALRGNFFIELYWRFRTPQNREIRERIKRRRNDLSNRPLPAPDTPIVILYLSDKRYMVL